MQHFSIELEANLGISFVFGIKNKPQTAQCVGIPLLNTPHVCVLSNEALEQTSAQYVHVCILLLKALQSPLLLARELPSKQQKERQATNLG